MEHMNLKAQSILRAGGVVTIEGVDFIMDGDGIVSINDTYIAQRNREPQLLTARYVEPLQGWITPWEIAYAYDISECVRVKLKEGSE